MHGTGVIGENLVRYPFFHHKSLIDCSRIEPGFALSASFLYIFFCLAQQPPLGQGLLIHEVSRSDTRLTTVHRTLLGA